jgi:hypothetical protein
MLLNSELTNFGIILLLLTGNPLFLFEVEILNAKITEPIPSTDMLKMFEPKALPIDNAVPEDNDAVRATVNSGSVVESEINVNPIYVLPILLMAATLVAYLITTSLVRFMNTNATAMIKRLIIKSTLIKSALCTISSL